MVEVVHDDYETLVLWTEEVSPGDLGVVELNVSRSGGSGV